MVKYLNTTKHIGLVYDRSKYDEKQLMVAYSDASFLSEMGSKSRFGVLFYVAGALIYWHSAKPHRSYHPRPQQKFMG